MEFETVFLRPMRTIGPEHASFIYFKCVHTRKNNNLKGEGVKVKRIFFEQGKLLSKFEEPQSQGGGANRIAPLPSP